MKSTLNESLLCDLKTVLGCLDENSELADSQRTAMAIIETLKKNSYTVYGRDFGNMSWKDECNNLRIPHEAIGVEIAFLIKEVKLDTPIITKRFCSDNTLFDAEKKYKISRIGYIIESLKVGETCYPRERADVTVTKTSSSRFPFHLLDGHGYEYNFDTAEHCKMWIEGDRSEIHENVHYV